MEDSVKEWSNQVEQLSKVSKDLIKLGENIGKICDQIKVAFLNVCVKIEKLRYNFESFLRCNIISNPENTPAALVAVEMENLSSHDQGDLIMTVVMIYDSLKKIQDVYGYINLKVNGLRFYFDGFFKAKIEESTSMTPLEVAELSSNNITLPFKVLRPDILTLIEDNKVTYEGFITDLQVAENKFNSTLENETLSAVDSEPAWLFKLLLIDARGYTNEAINAYKNILAALDNLQVFIDGYQKENLATLTYIGTLLPRLEAVRLALQIPHPHSIEGPAIDDEEFRGHRNHRSR